MMDEPKTMTETMIRRNGRVKVRYVDDAETLKAAHEAMAEYSKIGDEAIKEVKRIVGID